MRGRGVGKVEEEEEGSGGGGGPLKHRANRMDISSGPSAPIDEFGGIGGISSDGVSCGRGGGGDDCEAEGVATGAGNKGSLGYEIPNIGSVGINGHIAAADIKHPSINTSLSLAEIE